MQSDEFEYHYSKQRLPQGESYGVKRSDIDALLSDRSVPGLRSVYLGRGGAGNLLASASFVADHMQMAASGTTSLTFLSVPSGLKHDLRDAMMNDGLQQLVDWIEACEHAAETWRLQRHYLRIHYRSAYGVEGVLLVSGDDVVRG